MEELTTSEPGETAPKKSSGFLKRLGRRKNPDEIEVPDALAYAASDVDEEMAMQPPPPVATDLRTAVEGDFDASINQSAPADLRGVTDPNGADTNAQVTGAPMPAAWFDDPMNSHMVRWWDGSTWTGHVRSRPAAA